MSSHEGLFGPFSAILIRDLKVTLRQRHQWLNPLLFFVIVVTLFPLGVGADVEILRRIAPGVIWVGALLACLLSLDMLFATDHADGTLEQLALTPQPLSLLVLAKVLAHWLMTGVPLIVISPLLVLFMQLPLSLAPMVALSLAIGTLDLSLIGAAGAALTVGLRHGGVLLSLLVLPLYVPVLIFGAGALNAEIQGLDSSGMLSVLAAIFFLGLALAPLAIAAGVRTGIGND